LVEVLAAFGDLPVDAIGFLATDVAAFFTPATAATPAIAADFFAANSEPP
jgi:hypothetical protein